MERCDKALKKLPLRPYTVLLNKKGYLNWCQIKYKWGLRKKEAYQILKDLVSRYDNVKYSGEGKIVIDREGKKTLHAVRNNYKKKKREYKDVTKP